MEYTLKPPTEAEIFSIETLPVFRASISKKKILELAEASVSLALENGNVLEVAEALSSMAEFVELVRKNTLFIDAVVTEAEKNKGKIETASGAKIEVCETGVRYNYSSNQEWVELTNQEKEISEKRKSLEERLKKIPAGKLLVDEESGETLQGPSKTSKTNFKLSLPK